MLDLTRKSNNLFSCIMNQTDMYVEYLSKQELEDINGGTILTTFLVIGAGATAVVAIYEVGKSTGEFIAELVN